MNSHLDFTIIIATYNAQDHIYKILENIHEQDVKNKKGKQYVGEICFVDGGSTDLTFQRIESFVSSQKSLRHQVRIINNHYGDAINAKFIGFKSAKSECVIFLDQDERFLSVTAIKDRIENLDQEKVDFIISGGYSLEGNKSIYNSYISEYGDPISLMLYNQSNLIEFKKKDLVKKLINYEVKSNQLYFQYNNLRKPNLIEMVSCGATINKRFLLEKWPDFFYQDNSTLLPLILETLESREYKKIKILCLYKDAISHDSASTLNQITSKVKWRIRNNLINSSTSNSGVLSRISLQKSKNRLSFILIKVILIFPIIGDTLLLCYQRKSNKYMIHLFLTYYVFFQVFLVKLQKLLNYELDKKRYDGSAI